MQRCSSLSSHTGALSHDKPIACGHCSFHCFQCFLQEFAPDIQTQLYHQHWCWLEISSGSRWMWDKSFQSKLGKRNTICWLRLCERCYQLCYNNISLNSTKPWLRSKVHTGTKKMCEILFCPAGGATGSNLKDYGQVGTFLKKDYVG